MTCAQWVKKYFIFYVHSWLMQHILCCHRTRSVVRPCDCFDFSLRRPGSLRPYKTKHDAEFSVEKAAQVEVQLLSSTAYPSLHVRTVLPIHPRAAPVARCGAGTPAAPFCNCLVESSRTIFCFHRGVGEKESKHALNASSPTHCQITGDEGERQLEERRRLGLFLLPSDKKEESGPVYSTERERETETDRGLVWEGEKRENQALYFYLGRFNYPLLLLTHVGLLIETASLQTPKPKDDQNTLKIDGDCKHPMDFIPQPQKTICLKLHPQPPLLLQFVIPPALIFQPFHPIFSVSQLPSRRKDNR